MHPDAGRDHALLAGQLLVDRVGNAVRGQAQVGSGDGLGASHQTGWSALVAKLIQQHAEYTLQGRMHDVAFPPAPAPAPAPKASPAPRPARRRS